jgi:hypothetical protein
MPQALHPSLHHQDHSSPHSQQSPTTTAASIGPTDPAVALPVADTPSIATAAPASASSPTVADAVNDTGADATSAINPQPSSTSSSTVARHQFGGSSTATAGPRLNLVRRTWHRLHDQASAVIVKNTTASTAPTVTAAVADWATATATSETLRTDQKATRHDKMPSKNNSNSPAGGQVTHRLRNFFRMNSTTSTTSLSDKEKDKAASTHDSDITKTFRNTKFFSSTVGRLRSHTSTSEGNPLDEALSPTAHANPYFAHQGQPGLRHHNDGSVPPSPPDSGNLKVPGSSAGKGGQKATTETKEELARRLRRVASAPNTQGLFAAGANSNEPPVPPIERPATAELGKDPLIENADSPGALAFVEAKSEAAKNQSLGQPQDDDVLAGLPAPNTGLAFRRTYSSNSIKVRNVEVSPASFDKVKLIGKGDVGKVYLVREKKSNRLYAMKGELPSCEGHPTMQLVRVLTAMCNLQS